MSAKLTALERANKIVTTGHAIMSELKAVLAASPSPADTLMRLLQWVRDERKFNASSQAVSDAELVAALQDPAFGYHAFSKADATPARSVVPYATLDQTEHLQPAASRGKKLAQ